MQARATRDPRHGSKGRVSEGAPPLQPRDTPLPESRRSQSGRALLPCSPPSGPPYGEQQPLARKGWRVAGGWRAWKTFSSGGADMEENLAAQPQL